MGEKVMAEMRPRQRLGDILWDSMFHYAINLGGAGFGTGLETIAGTIPIQSDANFLCVHSMYETGVPTATNATRVTLLNGGVVVQLTDGASQRALSNIPIPADTLFGSAERPYLWPLTHLFRANTSIGIQITGQGAAVVGLTFRFVFGGFKVKVGSVPGTNL
jgi:hypothetical protein